MTSELNLKALIPSVCTLSCGVFVGWMLKTWVQPENVTSEGKKEKLDSENNTNSSGPTYEESFSDFVSGDQKLVLVVQNGLKMGKGKIAAQCSHASVMAYRSSIKYNNQGLKKWLNCGQRKVVVKVDNEESLLEIADHARKKGLIVSLVCDAGRTQIPSGSKTVLGVGPGPDHLLDAVTGHLKLL